MKRRKDSSEIVRHKLNRLPEKDAYGNNSRFGSQFVTWLLGGISESSNDQMVRKTGHILRVGAEKSFADYVGQKVSEEVTRFFRNNSNYG